jgi:hypothetical protein
MVSSKWKIVSSRFFEQTNFEQMIMTQMDIAVYLNLLAINHWAFWQLIFLNRIFNQIFNQFFNLYVFPKSLIWFSVNMKYFNYRIWNSFPIRLIPGFSIYDKILTLNFDFDLYADQLIREYIRYFTYPYIKLFKMFSFLLNNF